ncbi:MAG TPA: hypothetical protein VGH73_25035 [Thermoanaerobaculia bacterium]|jgi:hypothetical protein
MSPGDLDYACHELARILGLDLPVPVSVLLRAAKERGYLDQLIACRRDSCCLSSLLPPPEEIGSGSPDDPEQHSSRELVLEALKAFWSWAGEGFGLVDAATYRRRLEACRRCPHYGQARPLAVYKLAGAWAADSRVCRQCGCVMSVKARLGKQRCPSRDSASPARSRWGDPYDR